MPTLTNLKQAIGKMNPFQRGYSSPKYDLEKAIQEVNIDVDNKLIKDLGDKNSDDLSFADNDEIADINTIKLPNIKFKKINQRE